MQAELHAQDEEAYEVARDMQKSVMQVVIGHKKRAVCRGRRRGRSRGRGRRRAYKILQDRAVHEPNWPRGSENERIAPGRNALTWSDAACFLLRAVRGVMLSLKMFEVVADKKKKGKKKKLRLRNRNCGFGENRFYMANLL